MSLVDLIRDRLPRWVWRIVASGIAFGYGVSDVVRPVANQRLPPARLRLNVGMVSSRRFVTSGRNLVEELVLQCGLTPSAQILDVGCGCGRLALPLSNYLSKEGSYRGFDIDRPAIDYCVSRFSNLKNFQFSWVDQHSDRYNPLGKTSGESYRFPIPEGSVDLVLMTSVLTHVLPPTLQNYLSEVRRVLRPTGRAWLTYFLRTSEVVALERSGRTRFVFPHEYGPHRIKYRSQPEAGICYDQEFVWDSYLREHLRAEKVFFGAWPGRLPSLSTPMVNFQDVVVTAPLT